MNLIEFWDIKKRYGKRDILQDVSFVIKQGEIFGLIGRSGCGKSTLLKILIGMAESDAGTILFEGQHVNRDIRYLRKNTGFATQDNLLFNELSVKENSFYFGKLYGMKKKDIEENFKKLVCLLGLEDFADTMVSQLSGGMVKRANILVSLIHKPKLLILDEPTTGLDPVLRKILWEYIQEINKTGTTILVTSHLLEEIEENCDRVAVLNKGRIIALASVKEYKSKYKNSSFNEIFEEILK